ncbi:MAG: histidine kinase [Lachnospiraceae bacterium]
MHQVNIGLNLYSMVVCIILVIYLWLYGNRKERSNIFFIGMCLFNIGMIIGDIPAWAFEGYARSWYPAALKVGSVIFFACSAPLLLTFMGYILEYLPVRTVPRRHLWRTACVLCTVQLICSVFSYWNGMYFIVGEGNVYQRGSWYWLSQFIPFVIYLMDTSLIIVCRKHIHRREAVVISTYVLLLAISELIQIFNFGIALINTGAAIAILIIFINIQSRRELHMEQQQKELAEAQVSITLSQIQPHFLYNTLTTIRQLCELDPKDARDAIEDFAMFLRINMDSLTNREPIPFSRELAHVMHYLNLEKRRFGDRLQVKYEINAQDFLIPPLTIQPIAENAVRHGILRSEGRGTVQIRSEETDKAYIITVSDDGVGFFTLPADEGKGKSHIGIANVRKRLLSYCGGTLEFSSVPDEGTTVVITIPKKE